MLLSPRWRRGRHWLAYILALGLVGAAVSACGGLSAIPDSNNPVIFGLSMVSVDDGWAVGAEDTYQSHGLLAHYQGGSWMLVTLPAGVPALHSVFMLSASEGWAVGNFGTILHYHVGSWSSVTSPTGANLSSVFMTSASEGWAVGGAILHYQQGEWTEAASNVPVLNSVFMLSASEGWAVGNDEQIEHYSGGQWQAVSPPQEAFSPTLNGVVFSSPAEGWAVGDEGALLHYHRGTWSDASPGSSGVTFTAVALVSPREGWAVGRAVSDSGQTGAIFHYTGGTWVQVKSPTRSEWNALDMLSADIGWAGGTQGTLLEYADGEWC
jgi:photosystem II stability/assembly factor-like uncharacterized protein